MRKPSGKPTALPAGGARRNYLRTVAQFPVEEAAAFDPTTVDLIFSTLDAGVAKELEPKWAQTTPVISTASAFRYEEDTPILVGGVNMDHTALIKVQQERRGWKGFVVPKSNCTIAGLVVSLKPILTNFGVKQVDHDFFTGHVRSRADPGLSAMDMTENVIPYIPGEEPKVETEPQKILGTFTERGSTHAPFGITATCTRVPVLDGHLVVVFVQTEKACTPEEVKEAMLDFGPTFAGWACPVHRPS